MRPVVGGSCSPVTPATGVSPASQRPPGRAHWLLWARRDLVRAWPVVLASAVLGGLPWLLGNAKHDWYSFHPGRNEGTWAHHAYNLVVSTLPEALGLRLVCAEAQLSRLSSGTGSVAAPAE